jgi:hypothetical protein
MYLWIRVYITNNRFLKKYFNVTTADVRSRLLYSLVPFNSKFYDISEQTPDLYGPFWIYTTLIFIIAAAGSLSGYLQDVSSQNFFQQFVPIATGIVYIVYIDIWNRIRITCYNDSINEMFWERHCSDICAMYLWIFIYYIYPYNHRMYSSFRSKINV